MYTFHKDKKKYFYWQYEIARDWIIPFIEEVAPVSSEAKVLEIGCAQAGVLSAFSERGLSCVGIEFNHNSIKLANEYLAEEIATGQVSIVDSDIYDIEPSADNDYKFDLILLKDVIEHIFDQEKFLGHLKKFLKPGGRVFFGFPPWQMPFGGHQQICKSKFLRKLPYFHLFPAPMYRAILKLGKEIPNRLEELMEIKETGLSIERFNGMLKRQGYKTDLKHSFLTNPIYSKKFGLKTRKQLGLISAVPVLRNFLTTAVYYLVSLEDYEKEM